MIPYDFDYYQPSTIEQATSLYQSLRLDGRKPKFFSGGTEIITLGRLNKVYTDAVIDLKKSPNITSYMLVKIA